MYKKITLFQKLIVCAWLFGVIALFASFLNSQNVYSRNLNYQAGLVTRKQTDASIWKSNQVISSILSGNVISVKAIAVTVIGNPAQEIINKILMAVAQAIFKFVLAQLQKIADMVMKFLEGITDMFNKLSSVITGKVAWLQDLLHSNADLCKSMGDRVASVVGLTGLAFAKSPLEYAFENTTNQVSESTVGMFATNTIQSVKYTWNSLVTPSNITANAADDFGGLINGVFDTIKSEAINGVKGALVSGLSSNNICNREIHTPESAVAEAKYAIGGAGIPSFEGSPADSMKKLGEAYYKSALPVVTGGTVGFNGNTAPAKALEGVKIKIADTVEKAAGKVEQDTYALFTQLPLNGFLGGVNRYAGEVLSKNEVKAKLDPVEIGKAAIDSKKELDAKLGTTKDIAVLSAGKCEESKLATVTPEKIPTTSNITAPASGSLLGNISGLNPVTSLNIAIAPTGGAVGALVNNGLKPVQVCTVTPRTNKEDEKIKIDKTVNVTPPPVATQAQPSLQSLFQQFIADVIKIGEKLIKDVTAFWNKMVSSFQEILNIFNNAGSSLSALLSGGGGGAAQILSGLVNGIGSIKDGLNAEATTQGTNILNSGVVPEVYPLGAYRNVKRGDRIVFNPLTNDGNGAGINLGKAKIVKINNADVVANTQVTMLVGGADKPAEIALLPNLQEIEFIVPNDPATLNTELGAVVIKLDVELNGKVSTLTCYLNVTNSGDQVPIN